MPSDKTPPAAVRAGDVVFQLSVQATAESGTLRAHVELLGERAAPFPLPDWASQQASQVAVALCEHRSSARDLDLDRLSLDDLAHAARVASFLEVSSLAMQPLVEAFGARLRGKSTAELRAALHAPNDITDPDTVAVEPLFTPLSSNVAATASCSGDDGGAGRSTRLSRESAPSIVDIDRDAVLTCLSRLDAATLRSLKQVSRQWRRHARSLLGR